MAAEGSNQLLPTARKKRYREVVVSFPAAYNFMP